jgi:A/G-specific adenine glycosylase
LSRHGRDFFWREGPSAVELTRFQLLLVEFLLWKTNAARSHELILRIVKRYPEPKRVLRRSIAQLEEELRPLGLFRRRASCLHAFAGQLVEEHGGRVPSEPRELQALKGIGQYAARATACVLDGSRLMPVDANTSRLFGRLLGVEGPGVRTPGKDWDARLDPFVPKRTPRRFLWAVMDLCAAHCKARTPDCGGCPLRADCATGAGAAGSQPSDP